MILEVVISKGFTNLNHSVMCWLKGKGALGSPRTSVVSPPRFRYQTQPEFPAALE